MGSARMALCLGNMSTPSSREYHAILPLHAHNRPVMPSRPCMYLSHCRLRKWVGWTTRCFGPQELANTSHTSRQSACSYTLSGLMHPHDGACVQSVPSRTSIYASYGHTWYRCALAHMCMYHHKPPHTYTHTIHIAQTHTLRCIYIHTITSTTTTTTTQNAAINCSLHKDTNHTCMWLLHPAPTSSTWSWPTASHVHCVLSYHQLRI